jgi:hypothetical protein
MNPEKALFQAFAVPNKRQRYINLLDSNGGREKIRLSLDHFKDLDPRFARRVNPGEQNLIDLLRILRGLGAPAACHVISLLRCSHCGYRTHSGSARLQGCYLLVEDFRQEGEEATLRLREKGDKRPDHRLALRRDPGHPPRHPSGRAHQLAAVPAAPAFAYRGTQDDFDGSAGHVGRPQVLSQRRAQCTA